MTRKLGRAHRPARNGFAVHAADQKSFLVSCQRFAPLRFDLFGRRKRSEGEDRRAALMGRQREVDRNELVDLLLARLANLEPLGHANLGLPRYLPDPMPLLVAEAQAEPRVD